MHLRSVQKVLGEIFKQLSKSEQLNAQKRIFHWESFFTDSILETYSILKN